MKFNSTVNFATSCTVASSCALASSSVPGTAANEGEVTQVDLTMSNESVDDFYGGNGGHSPPPLLMSSGDTSLPCSSMCTDAHPSLHSHSLLDDVINIISSKNSLDICNEKAMSNHLVNIACDLSSSLSSFSPNRPHYQHKIMPHSSQLDSSCNRLSHSSQISSKPTFIHRSVSPCYLSSNSLSSSLSAISSSSVSSSSSSSDNDSLDELEHLASKFTHNIASIWSHSHAATSHTYPGASGDSDNTIRQHGNNESRCMSLREQNLPPRSQPMTDISLNQHLFNMKTTLGDSLNTTDIFSSSPNTRSHGSTLPNIELQFKLPEETVSSQISPSGNNCQSIWSFDSQSDHTSTTTANKKCIHKTGEPKKNESKYGKNRRDISSIIRSSQVDRSGGNDIETIDLTGDEETAASQANEINTLSQHQTVADEIGTITWLEKHMRLTSINNVNDAISKNVGDHAASNKGEFHSLISNFILHETLLSPADTDSTAVPCAQDSIGSKSNDTVTHSIDDSEPSIDNNNHSVTSPPSLLNKSIQSCIYANLSTPTGAQLDKAEQDHSKLNGCSLIDKESSLSTPFHREDIIYEHVSLVNHTASSLFKPGVTKKCLESDTDSSTNFSSLYLSKDELFSSVTQSEIPNWYLHYLANVISNESSRGLSNAPSDMASEQVNQLKCLYQKYFETHEDLYISPKTHFQPIRQDYYERPCNIVTDASVVGIIPCSRNCPNHSARKTKGGAGKTAIASSENDAAVKEQNGGGGEGGETGASGGQKGVVIDCSANTRGTNNVVPNARESIRNSVSLPIYPCQITSSSNDKRRPMSESREELASFMGPFSPIDSHSMSDSEEYPNEDTKSSRGPLSTSDDSVNIAKERNNCNTRETCDGNPCLESTFNSQGKSVSQRELTTLSDVTTRAHASMTDGNGDIEVPSKCSSNIDAKTEGERNTIRQLSTGGESGTDGESNNSLGKTTKVFNENSYNTDSNEMIIDAPNMATMTTSSISSKNRCQQNLRTLGPHLMSHSTSKVIIEEVESDEVSSSDFMFNSTPSKSISMRSTVTVEDAPINDRPDSPVDDYDAIFSIVNDVLKSNQIVIEEGDYEDEFKLLPSELKQDQRFVHSNLFSSSHKNSSVVSSSNFIPSNNNHGLDWSIDSPHNWSMFSSKLSSSSVSSPAVNHPSPPGASNAVSSTTCANAGPDASSSMDTYDFSPSSSEKYPNRLNADQQADVAIFFDGSSNSSSASSGYFSYNQKQPATHSNHQHPHVSSTVSSSDNVVSSSNRETFNGGPSIEMACSPSTAFDASYYQRKAGRNYPQESTSDEFYHHEDYTDAHIMHISLDQQISPKSHTSNRNGHVSSSKSCSHPDSSSLSSNHSRLSVKSDPFSIRRKSESTTSVNGLREKSSSPSVYQIEARLEKVTAFSNKPCTFFLEGNCRKSDCKYSHDLSTITCKFWKEGFCFKGDLCPFAHDDFERGSQFESSPSLIDAHFEEEKTVFTIDSEADFPSLADEKRPKLDSSRNVVSDVTRNIINSQQVNGSKHNNSHKNLTSKNHTSKNFTAVASVLNSSNTSAPFLSSSHHHSTSNVLFIDKSQSNGKGKKKKRTAPKAI